EVALEVAGTGALVGVSRVLVLAALHDVSRIRETDLDFVALTRARVSTGVIEMKVSVDHHHDVGRTDANLRKAVLEHGQSAGAFVLQTVDALELGILLVAGSGVNENQPRRMLAEGAAHAML